MTVYIDGIEVIQDPRKLAHELQNETVIGFDTETTGLSPWRNSLALMQFYGANTNALGVIQTKNGIVPEEIKELFQKDKLFIAHNAVSFDAIFCATHEVPWDRAQWYDTFVGETVVVSTGRHDVSKSLRASARRRLGKPIDKTIEHGHWDVGILSDRQLEYAAQDVISLPALMLAQQERAEETGQQEALKMEMELMPIVSQMMINGLPIDRAVMNKFLAEQEELRDKYEDELFDKLGAINVNSHAQIKQAVKKNFGLTWSSTAADVLQEMTLTGTDVEADLASLILNYRAPAKRLDMYTQEWMDRYLESGWVHPKFWQCSADTGRFTCSDPNLQQWPRDSRWVIGNLPGYSIVKADLSQIEVRVAAYVASDTALLQALDNEDIHKAVASALFNIPFDAVTKEQRRMAKAASFALLYCGGPMRLYRQARTDGFPISYELAEQLFTTFFTRFQGLKAMRNKAISMSKNNRVVSVRMPNGLRRILTGASNRPSVILNNTVQGFAAVCLKAGMLEADKAGLRPYLGGQVHDELVAVVADKHAEEAAHALQEAMVKGAQRYLPITVKCETKVGPTWS